MCTLSWLYEDVGYQVFFNRDEQKSRPRAIPPQTFQADNQSQYLMPLDPQGNGSWIGVNEHGLTVCLLNYYQGTTPKGLLTSRGLLVRHLLSLTNLTDMKYYVESLNKDQFAPFTLVLFALGEGSPMSFQWDGVDLHALLIHCPYTSSGVEYPIVSRSRQACFHRYLEQQHLSSQSMTAEHYLAFHRSHWPSESRLSVCMHRDDAQTVSLSHIDVHPEYATFDYWDGPPCETKAAIQSKLPVNLEDFA